jgi:squalene synthase HpnC
MHQTIDHYENFPVASWLCPRRLRAPVAAIYHFARTADDLADEGQISPEDRLEALLAYRQSLKNHQLESTLWPQVFVPLHAAIFQFDLPLQLLDDLLDAFIQDVSYSAQGRSYNDQAELLHYCSRSANPVGRLLLHLYDLHSDTAVSESDAICSALQLINFWQDLGQDLRRGRNYMAHAELAAFELHAADVISLAHQKNGALPQNFKRWMAFQVHQSRALMLRGKPLVHRIPGRAGWELRMVVQGGLRILDKIEALDFNTLHRRPVLELGDILLMGRRALSM